MFYRKNSKNIIKTSVGQCGNQIGAALWPLILKEYDIGKDNAVKSIKRNTIHPSFESFFHVPDGNYSNLSSYNDLKTNDICARVINNLIQFVYFHQMKFVGYTN